MIEAKNPPKEEYIEVIEQACHKLKEGEADELRVEIKNMLKKAQTPRSNISKEEFKAIRELKEDDSRIILTTDKGVALVVLNKEDYIRKAEHLLNQQTYRKIKQWSILSNILNYVQHSKFNSMNHTLDVKAVNRYKIKPDTGREFKELNFGITPQKLQEEYMDIYEEIHSDIVSSNRFDENSDICTMYLGRIENTGSQDKLKQKSHFLYQKLSTLWVDY